MDAWATVYRFTTDDYHAMADAAILPWEPGYELVDGRVFRKRVASFRHGAAIARLSRLLILSCREEAIVRVGGSISLPPYSEPEPDIVLLAERADFYATTRPGAADTLLIVEVADASLAYDSDVKASLYARAGVPEYWILDLEHDVLVVHRLADVGCYGAPKRLVDGRVSPECLPSIAFEVADVLATAR